MRFLTLCTVAITLAIGMAGCDKFTLDPRSSENERGDTVGASSKTISANSITPESLVGDGAIGGAKAVFNPGVLSIDTSVEMVEGLSIADEATADLGLGSGSVTEQGTPVVIDADTTADPVGNLVISLPLPESAGLNLAETKHLAILYKIEIKALGLFYSGILPAEFLDINSEKGIVTFEFPNFGLFQAVYLNEAVTEKKQVEVATGFTKKDADTTPDDTTPPGAFSIKSPATVTNNVKPVIAWSAAKEADKYTVHLDNNSGCPSPEVSSDNVTTTSYAVSKALVDATTYFVCVVALDAAGNKTVASNDNYSFVVDISGPAAPQVTADAALTDDTTPTWTWTAAGGGNGKFRYKLDDADLSSGATDVTTTTFTPATALSGGEHTLYVQERDAIGNWSVSGEFTVDVDFTAPTANSIAINAGNTHTNNTAVTLTLASTGAAEMYVTDTAGCGSGGTWEPFATNKAWVLGATNQSASVYVQFKDVIGNVSSCIGDTITHDNVVPGSFTIAAIGYVTTDTVTISWGAASGAAKYHLTVGTSLGCSAEFAEETVVAATSKTLSDFGTGTHYVCATAIDAAGNVTGATNSDVPIKVLCDTFDPCTIDTDKPVADGATIGGPDDLVIAATGILRAPNFSIDMDGDVTIAGSVKGNVTVAADNIAVPDGGSIYAKGKGFVSASGGASGATNGTQPGGGGGHAGIGGSSSAGLAGGTATYGSSTAPNTKGSGGGEGVGSTDGGSGGGTIKLIALSSLVIDGEITVDGAPPASGNGGGGAGGSIWISSADATLTGSGILSAHGGDGGADSGLGGGGGSGGRIAVDAAGIFPGIISVKGGSGGTPAAQSGDYGSYYQAAVANICDTGTLADTCTISTPTPIGSGSILGSGSLTIASGGNLYSVNPNAAFSIDIDGTFTVDSGATFQPSGELVPQSETLTSLRAHDVVINGIVSGNLPLVLAKNDITISGTGTVTADGYGYRGVFEATGGGPTPGAGDNTGSGGGGGGGAAGGASESLATGGTASADTYSPDDFGSSGGGGDDSVGGNGGGKIKMVALGSMVVDGGITAHGEDGSGTKGSGGGGGGTIWIDAMQFAGAGSLSANGGDGGGVTTMGGGGGGGLIVVYTGSDSYTGSFAANGGATVGGTPGDNAFPATRLLGTNYYKIFVTSAPSPALFSGSACSGPATSASFPGTWVPVFSTQYTSASSLTDGGKPIINLVGEVVSEGSSYLWSVGADIAVAYDETLTARTVDVWTGSVSNGTASLETCLDFASVSTGDSAEIGRSDVIGTDWIDSVTGPLACNESAHLYCLGQ